jgi:DNA-binding beta-propeller fold protein YncE
VLPNGRRVEPAGTVVSTETLPLNLLLSADGRHLVVTNDGYGDEEDNQYLQVIDTETLSITRTPVRHFFGLAMTPEGRVFAGNHRNGNDRIESLQLADGQLTRNDALTELTGFDYPIGMALSPDARHLYVLGMLTNSFVSIDTTTGETHRTADPVGNYPYGVVLSPDGRRAYVSSWGVNNGNPPDLVPRPLPPVQDKRIERNSVALIDLDDPTNPRLLRYVRIAPSQHPDNRNIVGFGHPSAMAVSPDGRFLYVTATNVDLLVVVDTETWSAIAEIPLNVFEQGPTRQRLQGLYPNAIAVAPDGRRLYIADAGINAVQVINVDPVNRTFTPAGFIPAGYYPTAVALSADGKRLFVANGKGEAVGPNGGAGFDPESPTYYIAQLVKGSVSIVDDVDQFELEGGAAKVAELAGLRAVEAEWVDGPAGADQLQRGNPIPVDFGSGPSSLIKYVVFIVKEDRTYDLVLGEDPRGNGDPDLAFFGGDITPNQQALARQFGSGDNFFEDGEVSTPGHEWIDQANCNDWTEKIWPSNYDRDVSSAILEQGLEGFTKSGFLWTRLERDGVSYRVFGETLSILSRFATGKDGQGVASVAVPIVDAFGRFPNLEEVFLLLNGDLDELARRGVDVDRIQNEVFPNHNLRFPSNILANRTDVERAQMFNAELDQYIAAGEMPSFVQIWLPNDHTFGASPGNPTPRSAVADNDEGLGLIVDALTHSPFWPQMAIFVTEDDAQDGQDHVSAYRTIALTISPYVKHGYVSHVHHSNVSMSKTMELILGIEPLSQFDRYSTDMRDYFVDTPDLTPYDAIPRKLPPETFPAVAANAHFQRAAEISKEINLDLYDTAGAGLSRVIELMHYGQLEEEAKAARQGMVLAFAALLLGALLFGRKVLRAR